ncbi:MAG: hypothetical protein WBD31_15025 [Rubripirellula sp.]
MTGDGSTYEDGGNWGGTAPVDDLTTNTVTFSGVQSIYPPLVK